MEHITSSSNPKIRQVRDLLARTGARRKAGLFVVEGPKMVEEAFRYAKVQSVFVAEASMKETADGGEHGALLAQLSGCPSYEVPDSLMKSLSDTVHPQGVLAVAEMPSYDLQAILAEGDDRLIGTAALSPAAIGNTAAGIMNALKEGQKLKSRYLVEAFLMTAENVGNYGVETWQ